LFLYVVYVFFFFQEEDGDRDADEAIGVGDLYKKQNGVDGVVKLYMLTNLSTIGIIILMWIVKF